MGNVAEEQNIGNDTGNSRPHVWLDRMPIRIITISRQRIIREVLKLPSIPTGREF